MALMKHPDVNASWTDTAILRHKHADVGVAVALDFGLITPIVFSAENKGLAEISNEVKTLAERARNKKLKPPSMKAAASRSPISACSGSRTSPPSSTRRMLHHRGGRGRGARHRRGRQGRDRHDDDRDHVLRSPRGGRRHRRQIPSDLQAVYRRTCLDAVVRGDDGDLEAILETGSVAAVEIAASALAEKGRRPGSAPIAASR